MSRHTLSLCVLLLLAACKPADNQPPAPKLFEEQRDAVDKAKAVEGEQQQQAEEQKKQMEQQTQ